MCTPLYKTQNHIRDMIYEGTKYEQKIKHQSHLQIYTYILCNWCSVLASFLSFFVGMNVYVDLHVWILSLLHSSSSETTTLWSSTVFLVELLDSFLYGLYLTPLKKNRQHYVQKKYKTASVSTTHIFSSQAFVKSNRRGWSTVGWIWIYTS